MLASLCDGAWAPTSAFVDQQAAEVDWETIKKLAAFRRNTTGWPPGDYGTVLRGVDDNVHHRFAGQHPLGGERHSNQALRLWFQQLFRLYRSLIFQVHRITISGWPWDLKAAGEWSATMTPVRGAEYINRGVHIIRIRRGRVTQLYAYEDSQAVAEACQAMADLGVNEGFSSDPGCARTAHCGGRCTTAADGRPMSIHPHKQLLRSTRAQAHTTEFKQDYPTRSSMERIIAWVASQRERRLTLRCRPIRSDLLPHRQRCCLNTLRAVAGRT